MTSENVSKLTVVGRMECAHGSTAQKLYVTIANDAQPNSDTVRLLGAQSTAQQWCLVRTPSMGERFIVCSYPTANCVLQATEDKIDGYENAYRIMVVKLDKNIVLGQPLPIPMDKTFQFRYEEKNPGDNCKTGCFIVSESGIFKDTVMQGGYEVKDSAQSPPKLNDHVTIHLREKINRELFWFDTPPTKQ